VHHILQSRVIFQFMYSDHKVQSKNVPIYLAISFSIVMFEIHPGVA
jgi:hypothetical protein